jgi:hypothetical protein
MVTLDEYRNHVRALLTRYVEQRPPSDPVETQMVADTESDHYQLARLVSIASSNVKYENSGAMYAGRINGGVI